jgi:hypothetical protein
MSGSAVPLATAQDNYCSMSKTSIGTLTVDAVCGAVLQALRTTVPPPAYVAANALHGWIKLSAAKRAPGCPFSRYTFLLLDLRMR